MRYRTSVLARWRAVLAALLAVMFCTSEAMAQDNAGIFFFGPPPTAAQIAAAAPTAKVSTSRDGAVMQTTLRWADVTLEINVEPDWDRDVQLSGIRGYVSRFPANERNTAGVKSMLANLDRVTTSYGSVISPAYDGEGKAAGVLLKLVAVTGGFFFSHQSFYDASGAWLLGDPSDPRKLGAK